MSTFDSIMAETAAICAPLTKAGGAPDGADSPADQQYFVDKLVAVRNFLSAEKDRAADSFSATSSARRCLWSFRRASRSFFWAPESQKS